MSNKKETETQKNAMDFIIATADICPHEVSSSICEWCGYKTNLEFVKSLLVKSQDDALKFGRAMEEERNLRLKLEEKISRIKIKLKKMDCECGGEEPDGTSPTCYRCEILDYIERKL